MKKILVIALLFFIGCGTGGKEDDTATNSSTSVSEVDSGSCPVELDADEAVAMAEEEAGEQALGVEEVNNGGLDQSTALRVFRVFFKNVTITVNGCDNTIHVEDNDSTSDDDTETNVDLGGNES